MRDLISHNDTEINKFRDEIKTSTERSKELSKQLDWITHETDLKALSDIELQNCIRNLRNLNNVMTQMNKVLGINHPYIAEDLKSPVDMTRLLTERISQMTNDLELAKRKGRISIDTYALDRIYTISIIP